MSIRSTRAWRPKNGSLHSTSRTGIITGKVVPDKRGDRKLTHYLVPECDSFSEGESRNELTAGGRILRRVHVSRGRADSAYVGTAHTKGVKDNDYCNIWTSRSWRNCSGAGG
jgi:hypothetical protein